MDGDVAQVALQNIQRRLGQDGLELADEASHVDVHQAQNIGHADEHREHGQDHEIGQAGRRLGHPAAEIEQDRLPKEGDEGRSPELFHRGTSWGRMVLGILGTGLVLNLSTGA